MTIEINKNMYFNFVMEKRPLGFSLVVVTEIQLIHYLVNLKNIYILKLKDLVD